MLHSAFQPLSLGVALEVAEERSDRHQQLARHVGRAARHQSVVDLGEPRLKRGVDERGAAVDAHIMAYEPAPACGGSRFLRSEPPPGTVAGGLVTKQHDQR